MIRVEMAGVEIEEVKGNIDKVRTLQKEIQEPAKDEKILKQLQESLSKLEHEVTGLKDQHIKFVGMVKEIPEDYLLYELYKALMQQEIISKLTLPTSGISDKFGGKLILKKEAEACKLKLEQLKKKIQKTIGNNIIFKS
jgi:hypothetical protein